MLSGAHCCVDGDQSDDVDEEDDDVDGGNDYYVDVRVYFLHAPPQVDRVLSIYYILLCVCPCLDNASVEPPTGKFSSPCPDSRAHGTKHGTSAQRNLSDMY